MTPTPASTADDTGTAASEGAEVHADTDAPTPLDTDLPTFDPSAPITLADLPGTYTSAPNAIHTVVQHYTRAVGYVTDRCRGEVTVLVSASGAVYASGACTLPEVQWTRERLERVQNIEILAQVRADQPHVLDPEQSTLRFYDGESSHTVPLEGFFRRNADHGRLTLRLSHRLMFDNGTYGFDSVQQRLYPWSSASR